MRLRSKENVMKKFCAFLAVMLSIGFAGLTFAQDKPASAPEKAAAAPDAKKDEAKPAAAPATPPTPKCGDKGFECNKGDASWMMTSTAFVLLMTVPGLALFYMGMVRTKNALSTTMQSFAIFCVVAVLWVIYGYSLAFTAGHDGHWYQPFIGSLDKLWMYGNDMNAPNY